jgi:hypothetical protein
MKLHAPANVGMVGANMKEETMEEKKSLLSRIVTWVVIGVLAVLALRIVLGLVGAAFGLIGFLLFTVAPLVLVGWLAVKAYHAFAKNGDSSAD